MIRERQENGGGERQREREYHGEIGEGKEIEDKERETSSERQDNVVIDIGEGKEEENRKSNRRR